MSTFRSKFVDTSTVLIYLWMTLFGYIRDWFGRATGRSRFIDSLVKKDVSGGEMGSLIPEDKDFYIRRVFSRFRGCFDRPICSPPAAHIDVISRVSYNGNKSIEVPRDYPSSNGEVHVEKLHKGHGVQQGVLNLGSYNYLGFADDWRNICGDKVMEYVNDGKLVATSTGLEAGYNSIHKQLEEFVARFLEKESALVFSMGYGTNSTVLSVLLEEGSAVLSDGLNHTSIVNGCRGAEEARIVPFKHNSMEDLELNLKRLILCGQSFPKMPETNEKYIPWKKLVVVVEGIYSMEGECCDLKSVNALCKKYKAFLYVDEAHSIGALGKTGRGICEHSGVAFSEIDILMGTFSKSFGGMGGYVAGDKVVIDKMRASCDGQTNMSPLATVIAKQVLTAFEIIDTPGGLGQKKIKDLHSNANYFRKQLKKIGCQVLGDEDSPVIPMMIYQLSKLLAFSQEMLQRNIGVVVVAFPATSMYEARARFCISAGHSKEDLKMALTHIKYLAKMLGLRYAKSLRG